MKPLRPTYPIQKLLHVRITSISGFLIKKVSLYDADHVESTLANAVDPFPVNVASTTCLQTRAEVNLDVPEHLLKYDTMSFTEGTSPFVLSMGDPRKAVVSARATGLPFLVLMK
jgi:hypothetical protein